MEWIFSKLFILENPILFWIVSFILFCIIVLAIIWATKESKKDVN